MCWQEVGQDDQGGDERAGQNDVDDVEERLPLNDQVECDLLVLQVFGGVLGIDHLPGWPVDDGPLAIFYVVKDAVRWRHCSDVKMMLGRAVPVKASGSMSTHSIVSSCSPLAKISSTSLAL